MLFALHVVDYGVLALYLTVMALIGLYFSREQHACKDFFLAGRTMSWFPVGLSVMATLPLAFSYTAIPGAAYYHGLKLLTLPVAIWIALPVMWKFILPLYQRLGLYSIYEYLELRFDVATRLVSSLVFVIWRLLWLGVVLYLPCRVLVVTGGLEVPTWLLVTVLGLVCTTYTYLGGMKAVVWTDVIQSLAMLGGLVLVIGGSWWSLDGGAGRVWDVAVASGRDSAANFTFAWSDGWGFWGLLPHFVFAALSFYVADQITAQRFLTTKDLTAARRSFLLNCIGNSFMVSALLYVGLCLLAFYQDDPQTMRPTWVVNVDHMTGEAIKDPISGRPLIDPDRDKLDASTIAKLVHERRVLRPNSKEPFTDAASLVDPESGKLLVDKLAMRRADQGEIILHRNAQGELMPRFITDQLPMGIAGLGLVAWFAAAMSFMDSGLNSICTLLITDFHRRIGLGRSWLAAKLDKDADQLSEEDELKLARTIVLILGAAATLFSSVAALIGDVSTTLIAFTSAFGGPLLAVFLLGIFTRQCTARAALVSLVVGTLFTSWLMIANTCAAFAWAWPFGQRLGDTWPLVFGVVFTLILGYVTSFFVGERKTRGQLRGLVVGLGRLGDRQPEEVELIVLDFED